MVICSSRSRDFADMESVLARLLDVMLIALGAALASHFFLPEMGHSIVEGAFVAFVAFDMALAILLLPLFRIYDSWRLRLVAWPLQISSEREHRVRLDRGAGLRSCLMFSLHFADLVRELDRDDGSGSCGVAVLGRMRRAGRNLRMVAVVGVGAHRDSVIANIVSSPSAGFRAVATFNTCQGSEPDFPGLPSFAHLRKFADWVRGEQIEEVWLALPMSEEHTVLRIIDEFSGDLVNLRFIPDVRSLAMFDRNVVDLIGTQ